MAFRYMNPGYGAWLNDSAVSTVENNFVYNPEHGISFTKQTASQSVDDNEIPVGEAFTTDISVKFNMYISNTWPSNFLLGAKSTYWTNTLELYYSCKGIMINSSSVYLLATYYTGTGGTITKLDNVLKGNSLNKIQFHIHRGEDAESSFGQITVNDTTKTVQFTSANYKHSFYDSKAFYIHFPTNTGIYISELIVSNDIISPKEKIIALPTSATATDMTAGQDGIYIADAANQSLLQSPDVAALIESYGADSTVTGVAVVGNPAYKTGTGITTLTSLSKANNIITEHNCLALSDDTIATIQDGWTISNATIADLQNMQFGWRAGE